jgi:hypothetical protein
MGGYIREGFSDECITVFGCVYMHKLMQVELDG